MDEEFEIKELIGKNIISEESGSKFGKVGDISFIVESGELTNMLILEPTKRALGMDLEKDDNGKLLIPFSAIRAVGEVVIISEQDIF